MLCDTLPGLGARSVADGPGPERSPHFSSRRVQLRSQNSAVEVTWWGASASCFIRSAKYYFLRVIPTTFCPHLAWHYLWHFLWHSIWHLLAIYLAHILPFYRAFSLVCDLAILFQLGPNKSLQARRGVCSPRPREPMGAHDRAAVQGQLASKLAMTCWRGSWRAEQRNGKDKRTKRRCIVKI
jgi:hypothetical protein